MNGKRIDYISSPKPWPDKSPTVLLPLGKTMTHTDPHTGEVKPGPFLRTPYNYDMNEASNDTGLLCLDKTMAQQQFKDECDINTIVERFGITGELPQNLKTPSTNDFWEISNYQEALNQVNAGREAFMQMPAKIRTEFDNDPGRFLEFVHDPDNRARAEKLGLIVPKEEVKKEPPKTET